MFLDQMFLIEKSKLKLDRLFINCIGSEEQINLFIGICSQFDVQILNCIRTNIQDQQLNSSYLDNNEHFDETITLNLLQEHAKNEDAYFLYFHSKGISATSRLKQSRNFRQYINYYNWRKFMEWGCIENWKRCIDQLETYSCSSVNLCLWPTPHYSGGFWWTKSSYVNKLPNILESGWWLDMIATTSLNAWNSFRLKPEMWIGAAYNNDFYSITEAPNMPPSSSLAETSFPRSMYTQD